MITKCVTLTSLFVLLTTSSWAAEKTKPLIDSYIQTVVSDDVPNRHNVLKRAILSQGETSPRLDIEVIDWSTGMGGQTVLLQKSLDLEAGLGICPDPAESWCGKMGEIVWKNHQLHYSFQVKGKEYQCSVNIQNDLSVTHKCQ